MHHSWCTAQLLLGLGYSLLIMQPFFAF